jgi:hypothetical protein
METGDPLLDPGELSRLRQAHDLESPEGTELIQDMLFKKGFSLTPLDPRTVQKGGGFEKTYVDTLDFGKDASKPVWHMAQWYSRYDLANKVPVEGEGGSIMYANEGKKIALYPDHSLYLEVDASREYDHPRKKGEHWPHILIAQNFDKNSPVVGKAGQLLFSMEIRLEKCENRMEEGSFDRSLHTAQTPFYFKLINDNRESPDYRQQIWFGLPSFDYRRTKLTVEEGIMWDKGTSTYMYFSPEQKIWGDVNLHDGEWHKGEADIKPLILRALEAMKSKEVFLNTTPGDLKITGMNFGWEVPGTFDAAIRVRHISLRCIE